MKGHILSQYGEIVKKIENPYVIYDFLSQISYYDSMCTQRVIDRLTSHAQNSTFETSAVETSDKDDYSRQISSTTLTENVEHSDADSLLLQESTIETRGTEISDLDNIWSMVSTKTTFSTEVTDKDC